MTSRLGWGFAVLGLVSVAFLSGCDRPKPRVLQPPFDPSGSASKAMELFDANKDGKIAGAELDKAPGLKASLKVMNTDKDKGVTPDMISKRVDKWIESKVGRTSIHCTITRNGQPLAGATVKFVPEPFLSDALTEPATGTTNSGGTAMLTLPTQPEDDLPPGMAPGMFRVEVTKDGETIPAKYNTNTELGQEISLDNMDIQMGIKFNLKY